MWKSRAAVLKDLFFPKRCFFCKKYGGFLCRDCQALFDISPVHQPDRHGRYLADVYAACPYENKFAQKMIRSFKYEPFNKELAVSLAQLIIDHFALSEHRVDSCGSVIVPVPLAQKRLRWRGFNQAGAIAQELGKAWKIPVAANCLARRRETKIQTELDPRQRLQNIKGAFVCLDRTPFLDKKVFLVDDVVTTRATMEECARTLRRNGAREVIGVAIARAEK